jgi:flagella basal body P-ring formation protein FlgA
MLQPDPAKGPATGIVEVKVTFFWRYPAFLAALALLPGTTVAEPVQSLQAIADAASRAAATRAAQAGFEDLKVTVQPLDQRLRLPACGAPLAAAVTGSSPRLGSMSVKVRCAEPSPWSLYVQATVLATLEVPVLVRSVGRGERIVRSDLELVQREIGTRPGTLILDPARIVGLEARRDLPAGSTLQQGQLAAPLLVERGQTVTLVAGSAGLEVRMQGRALDSGAAGDRLRVTNLSSGRAVEGVVAEDGTVRIP